MVVDRRLTGVLPPRALALSIDLEPLVDQVVARLKATGVVAGESEPPKRAFRAPEVASMLSISEGEVRELMANGELRSIRIGRIRLVPLSAIDAFLERKLAESA
jgi:excisionase family DNA binding protein